MKLFNENGYVTKDIFQALETAWKASPPAILADNILNGIAELIRYNTVLSVARAGTGHLGASLSIIELLTCIYYDSFNFTTENIKDNNRDIFVLSKGHAVPALYATLAAKGYIDVYELDKLRRLGGLQGHCDISVNGIEANTGSLAMGLSRAVGYALAKKRFGYNGNVIVIVGDGELQEGQIWEALLNAVNNDLSNLYIVVDQNKVQTDQYVDDITRYNDLRKTFTAMGFATLKMGVSAVSDATQAFVALNAADKENNKPKVFIADTIKGQGISFMQHTNCLKHATDRYKWHNKAPNRDEMEDGVFHEVFAKTESLLRQLEIEKICFIDVDIPKKNDEPEINGEPLVPAFSKALLELGSDERIVVFDADLEADCGLTAFRNEYPERFFEIGIMEQHMISAAAAFARIGKIPVINSYSAFLTSRSNEQIYNYVSEGGQGLFVGHMAGYIPATPGKSHQAYRDIACIKNIPEMLIYQPITANDCTGIMKRFFENEFKKVVYLRLSMAPAAVKLPDAPDDLKAGKSYVLKEGKEAIVFAIGPVIAGECFIAAGELEKEGISIEVRSNPWLNKFDETDIIDIINRNVPIVVVEDHFKDGGFGEGFFTAVARTGLNIDKTIHIAVESFTTTGFRNEVLQHFGMDNISIAKSVRELLK